MQEFRRAARLTQAELGNAVGVSRQTIVSMEGGNYSPSVYLAIRLARCLNSTVEVLFSISKEA